MTTETTTRIYLYIIHFFSQHGRPPHTREIMAGAGVTSASVVIYHLERLAQAGKIRYELGNGKLRYIGLNDRMAKRVMRKDST